MAIWPKDPQFFRATKGSGSRGNWTVVRRKWPERASVNAGKGEPGAVRPRVEVRESSRIEVDVTCDLRQLFARRAKISKKWTDLLAAQPGALPHPARHLVAARQEMLHSVALGANRRLRRIDATR